MSLSNLLKQLKRKLKSGKRRLTLGALILIFGASLLSVVYLKLNTEHSNKVDATNDAKAVWSKVLSKPASDPQLTQKQEEALKTIQNSQNARSVFVQKNYVCGQETEALGEMKPQNIVKYHDSHPDWNITINKHGQVLFMQQIEDLAAQCKQNAFFGLDKNGNLSLFQGLPVLDQVLRTFYQLNIEHLKSSLPKETVDQLYHGIRVTDLAEYNSVLSTFSDYAVEASGSM